MRERRWSPLHPKRRRRATNLLLRYELACRRRLPNGVVIDLECGSQDASLVKAMIVTLGVN